MLESFEKLAEDLYSVYREGQEKFGYHINAWSVLTKVERQVWYDIAVKSHNLIAGESPDDIGPAPYDSMR